MRISLGYAVNPRNQMFRGDDERGETLSDQHAGDGSRTMARVKSYGDVLREYEYHPEAKCADASGDAVP